MRIKTDDGKIGAGVRPLWVEGAGGIVTSQDLEYDHDILTIDGSGVVNSGGAFSTYRDCRLAQPSIVHMWPCDELSGTLADVVGSTTLTPTANGGFPQYGAAGPFTALPSQTAVVGGSGTNQGKFSGLPSSFGTTLPFTIEFWAYPTSAANGQVYAMWDGTVAKSVTVSVGGGGTNWAFTRGAFSVQGGTVTLNGWTLITATFNGTSIKLYQDGVLVGTTATTESLPVQTAGSFLNTAPASGSFQPFTGRVCLLSIFNTALTTFCNTSSGGGTDADQDMVLTAQGDGTTAWEFPIVVGSTRYKEVTLGTGLTGTDNGDDTITVTAGAVPSFATPSIALGSSAAAGAAGTVIRSDGTIAAFDATSPTTQAFGDSATVGTAAFAARRDHKHAMPANPSDATISVTDITTNNASTSQHGFLKKLSGTATDLLNGAGNFIANINTLCKSGSTPLTGAVTLTGGANIVLTQAGNDIAIAASAGGGGGSGFVATDVVWDAKGDLVAATGADAAVRVPVGANGQVLISDAAATPGVSWSYGSVLLYDYTVAGSDKATIDTAVDTPDAGIAGTSAFSTAYRVLEVWLYSRTDESVVKSPVDITLNNDNSAFYDHQRVVGDSTTAAAGSSVAGTVFQIFAPGASTATSVFGVMQFTFPFYASTVGFKAGVVIEGLADTTAANNHAGVRGITYRSTSALTRLKFAPDTAAKKFKVGTRLLIYAR